VTLVQESLRKFRNEIELGTSFDNFLEEVVLFDPVTMRPLHDDSDEVCASRSTESEHTELTLVFAFSLCSLQHHWLSFTQQ
jgi:hypothetical protein